MEEKAGPKVLFISGSIGMGHVTRDLEIAKELRRIFPKMEVVWMAEDAAARYLRDSGEVLLPDCSKLPSSNAIAENHASDYKMTLSEVWFEWIKTFPERAKVYCEMRPTTSSRRSKNTQRSSSSHMSSFSIS
jgi:UDP:flavonoid glycosyltransferase YjiC (YdhE family)